MRAGVSSRGTTWVSMGPLGWLIIGPFVLTIWFMVALAKITWIVTVLLFKVIVNLCSFVSKKIDAHKKKSLNDAKPV